MADAWTTSTAAAASIKNGRSGDGDGSVPPIEFVEEYLRQLKEHRQLSRKRKREEEYCDEKKHADDDNNDENKNPRSSSSADDDDDDGCEELFCMDPGEVLRAIMSTATAAACSRGDE